MNLTDALGKLFNRAQEKTGEFLIEIDLPNVPGVRVRIHGTEAPLHSEQQGTLTVEYRGVNGQLFSTLTIEDYILMYMEEEDGVPRLCIRNDAVDDSGDTFVQEISISQDYVCTTEIRIA